MRLNLKSERSGHQLPETCMTSEWSELGLDSPILETQFPVADTFQYNQIRSRSVVLVTKSNHKATGCPPIVGCWPKEERLESCAKRSGELHGNLPKCQYSCRWSQPPITTPIVPLTRIPHEWKWLEIATVKIAELGYLMRIVHRVESSKEKICDHDDNSVMITMHEMSACISMCRCEWGIVWI